MLILISGLPGTGKTRISRELASRLNAVHISSDSIRKKMLEKRTYSEEEKARVYSEMVSQVSGSLSEGKNVIADATFYKESLRRQMREAAEKAGTDFFLVECIISEEAARERISSRTGGDSEAKYGEYLIVKKAFEPISEERITIDTSLPVKESVETIFRSVSGIASMLEGLKQPSAYPHPISNLQLIQTHISWVFLTGEYAYKIKKPVKFSFLDFSTRERRKSLCEEEVRLNRRLCPDVYLGVVPITIDKHPSFGGTGFPMDYAVKMKQLPSDKIMSLLLNEGKVTEAHIRSIAKIIADFHSKIEIIHDKKYSSPEMCWNQVYDLFYTRETAEKACGMGSRIDFILQKSEEFIKKNRHLFLERQQKGFIRDCHGDLHSGNIFLTEPPIIFDCIEFSRDFRYNDTASEIAFMAMDLDAHGRKDFSQLFVSEYVRLTGDEGLRPLINYYLCYRANVRAKIASLTYAQHPSEEEKKKIEKYLLLAEEYAKRL